jgi:two-component system response regulator DesR
LLAAAAGGARIQDIAGRLYLPGSTVRNYISAGTGKTGARDRIEAAWLAGHDGWL